MPLYRSQTFVTKLDHNGNVERKKKLLNMCLELRFHLKNTEATKLSLCITVVFANMPQNKTYATMLNKMWFVTKLIIVRCRS